MFVEEVKKLIEKEEIKMIDLRFTDSRGKEQHMTIPAGIEDDDFFDALYSDFDITRVNAIRAINSDGGGRGAITEILVTNYEA